MDEDRTIKERSNLFIVSNRASDLQALPSSHRHIIPKKPPLPSDSNMFSPRSYRSSITESPEKDIILRGIFNHENQTVDVELTNEAIKWKYVKKKQFFNIVYLEKLYSIKPLNKTNMRKSKNFVEEDKFYSDGFVLHMFDKVGPNAYKTTMYQFDHPHHDTNMQWVNEISSRIPVLRNQKKVLVLLNPYCGTKTARSVFNFHVSILLANANIQWDLVEFHDNFPLRDAIIQNSVCFEDYYGIVLMGGDGSVSNFINIMLELISQRENLVSLGELREIIVTPLCIVPIGSTNMLANSLYGTNDISIPLMHLIYGNTIRIDLASAYTNRDKLHSFGFSYAAGLGTTLARYFKRYSKLGPNKVQSAITRALAKQRHRPIEVEIKYLKNKLTQPDDENLCTRNCKICMNEVKNLNAFKTIDMVQEFDSIANSIEEIEQNLSTTIPYRNSENWEIIRGSFISVAFLVNSTQWKSISPGGGLSKYAHLSDGCIDLVLIDQVSRKDLFRFIKRHANCKNQLMLPFVKSIRIKEAKIKILNADIPVNLENSYFLTSDKKENINYDSEDSQSDKNLDVDTQKQTLSRIGSFKQNKTLAGQNIFFIKNNNLNMSQSVQVADQLQGGGLKKSPSFVNLFKNKKKKSENLDAMDKTSRKSSLNGEEAISTKCASMWNCDWNLHNIREMHIKCNRRFLLVFGTGLDADTEFEKAGKCFGL